MEIRAISKKKKMRLCITTFYKLHKDIKNTLYNSNYPRFEAK